MKSLFLIFLAALSLGAREPLAQRIAHTDPAKFQTVKAVHEGPGQLSYSVLLDSHSLDTNLYFMHRGVMEPKSGLGHHFHNGCEEMFIIFDGEAQFTVDGRTSVLKGPAGAPCRMGHSHAIYNASDKPVQWMNISVTSLKGENDAFNLGDQRVGVPLDPIPVFMSVLFDRALLRPIKAMNGGAGSVQYRRTLGPAVFETPWAYLDHLVLPPGSSVGQQVHRGVAEVYYVMSGSGTVTVSFTGQAAETAPIGAGDAVPIQLNDVHAFQNTGAQPLEMLIVGVAREKNKELGQ
jgi:mannose-6-phosphate isomerase-like protein (cupin superfamily)